MVWPASALSLLLPLALDRSPGNEVPRLAVRFSAIACPRYVQYTTTRRPRRITTVYVHNSNPTARTVHPSVASTFPRVDHGHRHRPLTTDHRSLAADLTVYWYSTVTRVRVQSLCCTRPLWHAPIPHDSRSASHPRGGELAGIGLNPSAPGHTTTYPFTNLISATAGDCATVRPCDSAALRLSSSAARQLGSSAALQLCDLASKSPVPTGREEHRLISSITLHQRGMTYSGCITHRGH